ncbi:hypothetical protein MKL32_00395 [Acinetobacter sp. AOR34_HL]|jgi:hypothetical protein|uniref:hypothetical protein n=1 Tax=Acinetobacter sp. AOR34_HL TaxID=2919384 RepID=UPI0022EB02D4|nr:hypothetical protein [Acinetobacter sp. AOR34_HL]MDA3500093.1 hypothetical protein [Acinetobacter sp. AOR34_HL]
MSNSPGHIPIAIHPAIRNLNVRQISKMVATKIIEKTELNLQYNSSFCRQLNVATDLNTYEALAYYVDNKYFEKYSFSQFELINVSSIYDELLNDFKNIFCY